MATSTINIRDINPLEHITSDLAKARFNYQSILNGLVEWNSGKLGNVTVRLMTDQEPGFVDYTFPTKKASQGGGANSADPDSMGEAYSYSYRYPISAIINEKSAYNDKVDIRVTVTENAGAKWCVCTSALVYDEEWDRSALSYGDGNIDHDSESDSTTGNIILNDNVEAHMDYIRGQFVRIYYPNTGYSRVRWVNHVIEKGDLISDLYTNAVFERWSLEHLNRYMRQEATEYLYVVHEGKVYRPTGTLTRFSPDASNSGWEYFCDVYDTPSDAKNELKHGKVYLYDPAQQSDSNYEYAELFIYNGPDTLYGYPPYDILLDGDVATRQYNDGWINPSVIIFSVSSEFDSTNVIRWTATTDIESILLYRMDDGTTGAIPDISLNPTVRVVGGATEDNGGFAIMETSNYSEWPASMPKWVSGHIYSTDTSKGVSELQNYTATMIFDHADPNCKQCTIINYDGPDLDQGLAIYLPVESSVDGKLVYPKNGRTFEFLFRIWPNPAYNGHETADLIINKAQIYVYSVPSRNSVSCHGAPIAKFSMARLTNFYVFSENIAIPNRPVLIKAKFVYSETDREWKTYGYYQLPDCIFLSPSGFVNPDARGTDVYGVETAGFPLVQDPFSNYDLSPVMVDDSYSNRIG